MATFGERLRQFRLDKGWTQSELGEKIGYKRRMIIYLESNEREPNLETITKLSNLFQCSTDYLLGHDTNEIIPWHFDGLLKEVAKKNKLDINNPEVYAMLERKLIEIIENYDAGEGNIKDS